MRNDSKRSRKNCAKPAHWSQVSEKQTRIRHKATSIKLPHSQGRSLKHDACRNRNLSVFLCNHMASVLAQRGGSCSIVLTENMFFSSCITQPFSKALFFFALLLHKARNTCLCLTGSMCLCPFVSFKLQLDLNYNTASVKTSKWVKWVKVSLTKTTTTKLFNNVWFFFNAKPKQSDWTG